MVMEEEQNVIKMGTKDSVAFFLAGLLNNASYVIMIAGAKDISPSMVGLVYAVAMVPSFLIKITGPYWYHFLSYRTRIYIASVLMAGCFTAVGIGAISGNLGLELFGVVLGSSQQGFGEASFLAYTAFYESRKALTAWSSGTGVAGIFGFAWVIIFTMGCGFSFSLTLLLANVLPVLFWLNYVTLFTPPDISREHNMDPDGFSPSIGPDGEPAPSDGLAKQILLPHAEGENDRELSMNERETSVDLSATAATMTFEERVKNTVALWPYMIPLFVVYFAEYAMQAGVWAAIGFPVTSENARDEFYEYANWMYQLGVFVSRSSGMLWKADMKALWTMPALQLGLLTFFVLDAYFMFWYDWSLLTMCFVVGLFGGAVYVGGYSLMAETVPPHLKEFSLSAAGVSVDVGVACADVIAIVIQNRLYSYHHISD